MHTLRKTVATPGGRVFGADDAASVLGHTGSAVTARDYVQRSGVAPDVSQGLNSVERIK